MPNEIDGRPLIPEVRTKYGMVQLPDFSLTGDFEAAYRYLKDMFEPHKDTKSGPVRPLSSEEKFVEQNKPVHDFLKDL